MCRLQPKEGSSSRKHSRLVATLCTARCTCERRHRQSEKILGVHKPTIRQYQEFVPEVHGPSTPTQNNQVGSPSAQCIVQMTPACQTLLYANETVVRTNLSLYTSRQYVHGECVLGYSGSKRNASVQASMSTLLFALSHRAECDAARYPTQSVDGLSCTLLLGRGRVKEPLSSGGRCLNTHLQCVGQSKHG